MECNNKVFSFHYENNYFENIHENIKKTTTVESLFPEKLFCGTEHLPRSRSVPVPHNSVSQKSHSTGVIPMDFYNFFHNIYFYNNLE